MACVLILCYHHQGPQSPTWPGFYFISCYSPLHHTPAYRSFRLLSCSLSLELSLFSFPCIWLVSFLVSLSEPFLAPLSESPCLSIISTLLIVIKTSTGVIFDLSLFCFAQWMFDKSNWLTVYSNLFLLSIPSYGIVQKDITGWLWKMDKLERTYGPSVWASTGAKISSRMSLIFCRNWGQTPQQPHLFFFIMNWYLLIFKINHFKTMALNFLRGLLTPMNTW